VPFHVVVEEFESEILCTVSCCHQGSLGLKLFVPFHVVVDEVSRKFAQFHVVIKEVWALFVPFHQTQTPSSTT
jgi:hypothetical protein